MSEEQLKAFLEAVKADAALSEKLKAATDADAAVAIAKEAGFVISAEAFKNDEVSDEDLEGVAGGGLPEGVGDQSGGGQSGGGQSGGGQSSVADQLRGGGWMVG